MPLQKGKVRWHFLKKCRVRIRPRDPSTQRVNTLTTRLQIQYIIMIGSTVFKNDASAFTPATSKSDLENWGRHLPPQHSGRKLRKCGPNFLPHIHGRRTRACKNPRAAHLHQNSTRKDDDGLCVRVFSPVVAVCAAASRCSPGGFGGP